MSPEIQLSVYQVTMIVLAIIGGFWTVIVLFGRALVRQFDARLTEKFKKLDVEHTATAANVQQHAQRMAALEMNLRHVPTHEEITIVREGIAKISADNTGQNESLRRLENQLRLIHEWMLANK